MKIFKYILQEVDLQTVEMPVGTQILSVQECRDQLCIWALINDNSGVFESRTFAVIGTGNPIPTFDDFTMKFIGTAQRYAGKLVWHVFEIVPWNGLKVRN